MTLQNTITAYKGERKMTEYKIEIKSFAEEIQMQMESLHFLEKRISSLDPHSKKEFYEMDALNRIFEKEFYILRAMYEKLFNMIWKEKSETTASVYEAFMSGQFEFDVDFLQTKARE